MFPSQIRDRLVELINPHFDEFRDQFKDDFSRTSADMASRGHMHVQGTLAAIMMPLLSNLRSEQKWF